METANEFFNKGCFNNVTDMLNEFALQILKEIFEDGLGNLDENCSKDDLVEQYLEIKKDFGIIT